jgi:hypothetical protein
MKTRENEMVILQARPVQAPAWWPRTRLGTPAWVTCDADGNYMLGEQPTFAVRRWQLPQAKTEWLAEHDGRTWQFRVRKCTKMHAKRKRR